MTLEIISKYRPDVLINMAGQANVGLSWKNPQLTVSLNTIGLINILEAVRQVSPGMRVITVGSSDEYGSHGEKGANVTEDMPVNPMTPYAISKSAQDCFAQLYNRAYGMNVCMIRFFNLVGAGQAKGFMIPDFASGIAEVEKGEREYMLVGNLESARDFTYVKDAVRAVRLVAEKGHAGEVYNICSGRTYTAQAILDKLLTMSDREIEVRQDPARMRPSDTPVVCGNHDKLTAHTGWQPEIGIDTVLEEVLDYWRKQA
jgi:GDP-4-dehydro-6-deoxy-D-mannose reductase